MVKGYLRSTGIGDKLFDAVVYFTVTLFILAALYPFLYALSMSISSPEAVLAREVWLFPKGFSLAAYKVVVSEHGIWRAYLNTIIYAVSGTALSVVFAVIAAFPITRKNYVLKKFLSTFIIIPMFVGGGIVPLYILINALGMYNTMWAIVIPGALSTWNIILVKTYVQYNISDSIIDAARIDGLNDIRILFNIVIPLSKPILAVIALYSIVGYWNSYFNVLLYLPDREKQTLQLYLMRILIKNSGDLRQANNFLDNLMFSSLQLKYALIMFVILPIIMVYPFLQRYFIKGVLLGSLKG